ncbi:MAG: pseudouridine synthase [Candidatus Riflebacteria bacterium]|nr:pseudouridine synthase [Candidatus Riflebacteria bacterium]
MDADNPPAIKVNGRLIQPPGEEDCRFYAFNKPLLVVTTMKDERGRKTIADFLPPGRRLYPVGRLDYDSTGLLIITNHGELTNRLLHPSFKVDKEYIVKISGEVLSPAEAAQFSRGLELDDGLTSPCQLKKLPDNTYSVTIREGRKRQVRRMFAFMGRKVVSLHRIRFGPLKIGNLKAGELRELSSEEKAALLSSAGLPI